MSAKLSRTGRPMLEALHSAAQNSGTSVLCSTEYSGKCDWLVLYGVGHKDRAPVRSAHVKSGRRAILWDVGYWSRRKLRGALRVSIDHDHPHAWLDRTPDDSVRFASMEISLRNDHDPAGHIVLVGLGPKTRAYLGPESEHWERDKLAELRARFPDRTIIFRPKPKRPAPLLDCPKDEVSSIEQLLRGAALVVCRHSNVAVDAAIAGVPFECEDGAALWLANRGFTEPNRISFLNRLAWWQWEIPEARQAWAFIRQMLGEPAIEN